MTDNLVRTNSYTSSVSAADYRRLMERVITKWEENGVILTSEEKKNLIEYEKNESPSNLALLKALGKSKGKVQESRINN